MRSLLNFLDGTKNDIVYESDRESESEPFSDIDSNSNDESD